MSGESMDAEAISPKWQFSLRELLFVTVVVSLHLAAFEILYQYIERHKDFHVRSALAGGIGGLIGVSIHTLIERIRAGRTVVKLRTQQRRTSLIVGTFVAPSIVLATFMTFDRWLSVSIAEPVVSGMLAGLIMSFAFSLVILSDPTTRLCDSGIMRDGCLNFHPWSRIRRCGCTWDEHRLTIGRGGWRSWTLIVPPERRAAVEALLKEKLGQ